MAVKREQRHTRANPCHVCGGFDQAPRGQEQRCHGFEVNEWIHCSREEYSQGCTFHESSSTFSHRAQGQCKCGTSHDRAALTPRLHTNGRNNGNNGNKPLGTMAGMDDFGLMVRAVGYGTWMELAGFSMTSPVF
jgi:hypothetical protein